MIILQNDCCNCETSSYPCVGTSCPNINVPHYYCDICYEETDLYEHNGKQLCLECIQSQLND